MKLSEFKKALQNVDLVKFQQPDGFNVPAHFHITEAGLATKHFIDCGGTIRKESAVTMQLWMAEDYEHRLSAGKLTGILKKAAPLIGNNDLDVEIEYQSDTIGRYDVAFDGTSFQLVTKETDCLAKETCGITPSVQINENAGMLQTESCCTSGSGYC